MIWFRHLLQTSLESLFLLSVPAHSPSYENSTMEAIGQDDIRHKEGGSFSEASPQNSPYISQTPSSPLSLVNSDESNEPAWDDRMIRQLDLVTNGIEGNPCCFPEQETRGRSLSGNSWSMVLRSANHQERMVGERAEVNDESSVHVPAEVSENSELDPSGDESFDFTIPFGERHQETYSFENHPSESVRTTLRLLAARRILGTRQFVWSQSHLSSFDVNTTCVSILDRLEEAWRTRADFARVIEEYWDTISNMVPDDWASFMNEAVAEGVAALPGNIEGLRSGRRLR
ncbi:hypothetical protein S40285_09985 [Stachybotrys chlorohalonatus IBT 40285]|uniref:Uncharacterized protein n=1 Tax=Stachybotrys chlorohalonatus (strain IBT 40285) TaxID=1283841 RepID=A0A084QPS3_STAC4|nr:hypothetical protein S40285_09985 [Stachybotrys chlorohalonata IBT 40285]